MQTSVQLDLDREGSGTDPSASGTDMDGSASDGAEQSDEGAVHMPAVMR